MKKTLIAGAVGLIMTSGVALADQYSSTTTTTTNSDNPGVVSTTRVDKSVGTEDGMLTHRTTVIKSTTPVQPTSTTVERTTTTTSTQDAE